MRNKFLICAILLILLANIVSAADFSISLDTIKNKIISDEQAAFKLNIKNNLDTPDDYLLSFSDVGYWELYYTDPLSDYFSGINNVGAGEIYTTKLILKPIDQIGIGFHIVKVSIKSVKTGISKTMDIPVYIKTLNPNAQEYMPNVKVFIQFPEKVDPREEQELLVILQNKNHKNITTLELNVGSNIINVDHVTNIEPMDKKILKFPVHLNPKHQPQKDILKAVVYVDRYSFKALEMEYEIIDYTKEFKETEEMGKSLLKTYNKVVYKNEGNVEKTQTILIDTPLWKTWFVSSEPRPDQIVKQEGKRYRSWEIELNPGEEFVIEYYTSYRGFLYFVIIIILLYLAYMKFKSPIQITKHAKNIEMHEGGISEIKILLNIKNLSNKPIEDLTVIDKVPNITHISQDFELGTLRPTKIMQHEGRGNTIVQWNVDELDPHEERLIVYRVRSKLSILGHFQLPLAIIKYSTKSGKRMKVYSNRLTIGV